MATFDNLWQLLETFGKCLATFGKCWQLWQYSTTFSNFWEMFQLMGLEVLKSEGVKV